MEEIESIDDLKRGSIIDEKTLMNIFKCGQMGGMRRSLRTNSLVLLSYNDETYYKKAKKEEGIWKYTGMGKSGDQSLDYLQNKTLFSSNEKDINVYLFIVNDKKYKFIDQVFLAGEPTKEEFPGEDGDIREILLFPLIEVGKKMEAIDFLYTEPKSELENLGILDFPQYALTLNSVEPLARLMHERGIDTLTGPGGWFFTKDKFFNNPNTTSRNKNGYVEAELWKDKKVSKKVVFEGQNKYINPFYKTPIINGMNDEFKLNDKHSNEEKGLRIHEVRYRFHKGKEIQVKFIGNKIGNIKEQENPFVSVIIGPNGTGKSTVLGNIQKIMLDAINFSNSKQTYTISKKLEYHLIYQIGDDVFEISHYPNEANNKYLKNNNPILSQEVILPKKIISVAFSINDRFTYNEQQELSNEKYHYLGIKSSDNMAKVGEATKNLVLNIISSSQKEDFNKHLKFITDFVGVDPVFKIKYSIKKGFLEEVINSENINRLQNKLRNQSQKLKENIRFFETQEILNFYSYLHNKGENEDIFEINGQSISIIFNFNTMGEYYNYYHEFNILWHLFELKIFDEVKVYLKKGEFYKLEDASSGEAQYLTTMINILSTVDKDSLIIIDEPETSLHPNWQYKYIYGIREMFKDFKSCHFLMATHSHFFLSDLIPETSSVVSLVRKNCSVISQLHDEETFGWSPDDILYNIFEMKTPRNFYLQLDLSKLLSYISTGNNEYTGEIKEIFMRLDRLTLKDDDPLKLVIENAKGRFRNA